MLSNNRFNRIFLYFSIAIIVSNLFRFDILLTSDYLKKLPVWGYLISSSFLEASGILLGTAVALFLFLKKQKSTISLFGSSPTFSLLMALIPLILFLFIGIDNKYGINNHLYGLLAFSCSFIYCIVEEYGWRGYLQEELKGIKPWLRYTLIGVLWYLWHLSFISDSNFFNNLQVLIILIIGSWGLGQVAIATKSIIACACFHLVIQIISYNSLIKNGLDGNQKLLIIAICIVSWILILKKWNSKTLSKQGS